MDGVQELVGVTVLAATNRPDAIVIAFLGHFYSVFNPIPHLGFCIDAPWRLDRILFVGPPDHSAREEILKIRLKNMTVEPNIDIPELARLVRPPAIGIYIGYFSNSNTDRRVLRRRNRCSLPRGCYSYNAARSKRSLRDPSSADYILTAGADYHRQGSASRIRYRSEGNEASNYLHCLTEILGLDRPHSRETNLIFVNNPSPEDCRPSCIIATVTTYLTLWVGWTRAMRCYQVKNFTTSFQSIVSYRVFEISPETRRKKVIMQQHRYLIHRAERI